MDELDRRFHEALVALVQRDLVERRGPFGAHARGIGTMLRMPPTDLRLQDLTIHVVPYSMLLSEQRMELEIRVETRVTRVDAVNHGGRDADPERGADFESTAVDDDRALPAPPRGLPAAAPTLEEGSGA